MIALCTLHGAQLNALITELYLQQQQYRLLHSELQNVCSACESFAWFLVHDQLGLHVWTTCIIHVHVYIGTVTYFLINCIILFIFAVTAEVNENTLGYESRNHLRLLANRLL